MCINLHSSLPLQPDLLHSFYSLAWLSLSAEQGCCEEVNENGYDNGGERLVGYDTEIRQQVNESINEMSKLDCALGVCIKRKSAFEKAAALHDKHVSTK